MLLRKSTKHKRQQERKRGTEIPDTQKTINKMVTVCLSPYVIVWNINELNVPIKGQRLDEFIFFKKIQKYLPRRDQLYMSGLT